LFEWFWASSLASPTPKSCAAQNAELAVEPHFTNPPSFCSLQHLTRVVALQTNPVPCVLQRLAEAEEFAFASSQASDAGFGFVASVMSGSSE
jgi:hypothetical protein